MNDQQFHEQLQGVRQQLYKWTEAQHSHQTPDTPADDYLMQIQDLKSRINAMKNRTNVVGSQPPLDANSRLESDQFSLPSGPLFWQLFTSLRTDVQDLNHRMTAAEQDIADLEDRIDQKLRVELTPATTSLNLHDGDRYDDDLDDDRPEFAPDHAPGNSPPSDRLLPATTVQHEARQLDHLSDQSLEIRRRGSKSSRDRHTFHDSSSMAQSQAGDAADVDHLDGGVVWLKEIVGDTSINSKCEIDKRDMEIADLRSSNANLQERLRSLSRVIAQLRMSSAESATSTLPLGEQ